MFLFDSNRSLIFSTDFNKSSQNKISRKSVQRGLRCYIWTNGRTDMTCTIIASLNSATAPESAQKSVSGVTWCSVLPDLYSTLPFNST